MRISEALAEEVIRRCQTLARFSEDAEGLRRTFLCPPMRDCHREIANWVQPLGATCRADAIGNLRIEYPGGAHAGPRLLIGSHLDTVPNAGHYDGILGVVLAVALLSAIQERKLPFRIEVIAFSEEEGVRFGAPFLGSRALVGSLDDATLDRKDARGISIRRAIQDFGLNPAEISAAALQGDVLGYLEFHIEQGPVLENLGHPLGVVESIVGQSRLEVTFSGQANHAGTTPMHLRKDALAAAAEWIIGVEAHAESVAGLVATVGVIEVQPGTGNVIPGEARLRLDVRHKLDQARNVAVTYLIRQAEEIARVRNLSAHTNLLLSQPAVPMNSFLTGQVERAVQATGCEPYRMASGAGHDAMIMAAKIPAAMIFLRTPGGISHHPAESVLAGDVAKAIECGCHLLDQLANSTEFLQRTQHA